MGWYSERVPGLERDLYYFIDEEVEPAEVVVLTFLHERRSPDRWPSG